MSHIQPTKIQPPISHTTLHDKGNHHFTHLRIFLHETMLNTEKCRINSNFSLGKPKLTTVATIEDISVSTLILSIQEIRIS